MFVRVSQREIVWKIGFLHTYFTLRHHDWSTRYKITNHPKYPKVSGKRRNLFKKASSSTSRIYITCDILTLQRFSCLCSNLHERHSKGKKTGWQGFNAIRDLEMEMNIRYKWISSADLSRVTWIVSIDEVERRKETNIHWCINTMSQSIHLSFAEVLGQRSQSQEEKDM